MTSLSNIADELASKLVGDNQNSDHSEKGSDKTIRSDKKSPEKQKNSEETEAWSREKSQHQSLIQNVDDITQRYNSGAARNSNNMRDTNRQWFRNGSHILMELAINNSQAKCYDLLNYQRRSLFTNATKTCQNSRKSRQYKKRGDIIANLQYLKQIREEIHYYHNDILLCLEDSKAIDHERETTARYTKMVDEEIEKILDCMQKEEDKYREVMQEQMSAITQALQNLNLKDDAEENFMNPRFASTKVPEGACASSGYYGPQKRRDDSPPKVMKTGTRPKEKPPMKVKSQNKYESKKRDKTTKSDKRKNISKSYLLDLDTDPDTDSDVPISSTDDPSDSEDSSSSQSSHYTSPPTSPGTSPDPSDDSDNGGRNRRRNNGHRRHRCRHRSRTPPQRKLPVLRINKFDGSTRIAFINFWSNFKNVVHKNKKLKDEEKFAYLLNFLEGEALAIVSGFPVKRQYYEPAIKELHRRYARTTDLVEEIIKKFERIKASDDFSSFRPMFNDAYYTLMTLKGMGKEVNSLSAVLIPVLKQKIPLTLKREWNKRVLHMERKGRNVTITKFLNFLREQILIMEPTVQKQQKKPEAKPISKKPTKKVEYKGLTVQEVKKPFNTELTYCFVCGKAKHYMDKCDAAKNVGRRQLLLLAKHARVCFKCLNSRHLNKDCKARPCSKCKGNHHIMLHSDKPAIIKKLDALIEEMSEQGYNSDDENISEEENDETQDEVNVNQVNIEENNEEISYEEEEVEEEDTSALISSTKMKTILQTLQLDIVAPNGQRKTVSAILDTGAQTTFITEEIADSIGLIGSPLSLTIHTLGAMSKKNCSKVEFQIDLLNEKLDVKAIAVPHITTATEAVSLNKKWSHLNGLTLNTQYPKGKTKVDLLIGLDYYDQIVTGEKIVGNTGEPSALKTKLGWIVYGPLEKTDNLKVFTTEIEETTQKDLDILWKQDVIANSDVTISQEEQEALDHYKKTTIYDEKNKFYTVRLPFKDENVLLPDNYAVAFRRMTSNEYRMEKDPHLKEKFTEALQELINSEYVEEVTDDMRKNEKPGRVWYLPCQAVLKEERASTTCRVVFDGSSVCQGESLNQKLHTGPKLQPDLVKLLLCFRKGKFTLTADIKKMFNNIRMMEEDRDLLRFLYRSDKNSAPKIYRFTRVIFGLNPSPFQSIHTVQEHSRRMQIQFPLAAEVVLSFMYVDDLIISSDDSNQLKSLYRDLKSMFKEGGFTLTKFTSNSPDVLKIIPKEERNPNALLPIMDCDADPENINFKALGLIFNSSDDTFQFHLHTIAKQWDTPKKLTKRIMLSRASQFFDPVGYISPLIVPMKIILQDTWIQGLKWDDEIPETIKTRWMTIEKDYKEAKPIVIPRHFNKGKTVKKMTLHGFSDASVRCYAAVIYARIESEDGSIDTCLVTSKARLAPIKALSLPRLELTAAVTLAQLMDFTIKSLDYKGVVTYHADSQIVLHWLRKHPGELQPFVANRVSIIQQLSKPTDWHFVVGKGNPADIPSRGMPLGEFTSCSLWFKGPSWLVKPLEEHPQDIPLSDKMPEEALKEMKKSKTVMLTSNQPSSPLSSMFLDEKEKPIYSNLNKLLRVTELVHLAKEKFKEKKNFHHLKKDVLPEYTTEKTEEMLKHWIQEIQESTWPKEMEQLRQGKDVDKDSKLLRLDPQLNNGVIETKGRLEKGAFEPLMILPQHPITELIILKEHQMNLCIGPEQTLASLRKKFWIIGSKRYVRSIINKCLVCKRFKAKPCEQKMGQLPEFRQRVSEPFEEVGLDAFGPIPIKDENSSTAHGLIFTCANMRAIHLELVRNLTTDEILAAVERFIARRGRPRTIHSDNATSFRKLGAILIDHRRIQKEMNKKGIDWKFIPPVSPWHGGFYERLIQSIKKPLRIALRQNVLSFEALQTLLIVIEGVVNERPLTYASEDREDLKAITPAQLLTGRDTGLILEAKIGTETTIGKMFRKRMRSVNDFWKRWREEYVKKLLPYEKWIQEKPDVKKNDLVLIQDKTAARSFWPLARVLETYKGEDGKVRIVLLKTSKGVVKRPIQTLYLLEETSFINSAKEEESQKDITTEVGKKKTIQKKVTKKKVTKKKDASKPKLDVLRKKIDSITTRCGRVVKPNKRFQ